MVVADGLKTLSFTVTLAVDGGANGDSTVTEACPLSDPLVAVTVALPLATAVIVPPDTVATPSSEETHATA